MSTFATSSTVAAKSASDTKALMDRVGPTFDFESSFDRLDDGVMESRDDYVHIGPAGHIAHMDNSQLDQVQVKNWD